MYQLFRSKDELIAESLASRGPAYQTLLQPGAEDERSPRERILTVFERQDAMVVAGDYPCLPLLGTPARAKKPGAPGPGVGARLSQQPPTLFPPPHLENAA